jgi:osmotically-inducible protein OsmY
MYEAKISDPMISQKVNEQLSNCGIRAPCRITAVTRKGYVTLTGAIQYEYQRRTVLRATGAIDGVRSVIDHLQVIPPAQHWNTNPNRE